MCTSSTCSTRIHDAKEKRFFVQLTNSSLFFNYTGYGTHSRFSKVSWRPAYGTSFAYRIESVRVPADRIVVFRPTRTPMDLLRARPRFAARSGTAVLLSVCWWMRIAYWHWPRCAEARRQLLGIELLQQLPQFMVCLLVLHLVNKLALMCPL